MSQSLVSVIVPVFNASRYLRKCLESLKNQAYDRCEFILIDDGSTDDSRRICDEYCAVDSRFICFSQHNQGVAAARNHGLDVAKGEYIGFVDADDYVEPNMIQTLIHALIESNADVAECSVNLVDEHGHVRSKQLLIERFLNNNKEIVSHYAKQDSVLNYTCNKIFRATKIGNIRFPYFKTSEDYYFNVLVLNRCHRSVTLRVSLYNYVLHSQSSTGQSFHLGRLDAITSGIKIYDIQKAIHPTLSPYYAVYILEKIIQEYGRIQSSKIDAESIKSVSKDLIIKFRKYMHEVDLGIMIEMKLKFRWKHYKLFYFFPKIYSFLYKRYVKLAKCED